MKPTRAHAIVALSAALLPSLRAPNPGTLPTGTKRRRLTAVASPSPRAAERRLEPLWHAAAPGQWADVVAGDIQGDGADEIVAISRRGRAVVLSRGGRALRHLTLSPQTSLLQIVKLGNSSGADIVAWGNWRDTVFAYRPDGRVLWRYRPGSDGVDWVHIARVEGDRKAAVIVGYNGDGGLHLLNGDGRPRWVRPEYGNCWNVGFARAGRGKGYILTCDADGAIHELDLTGKQRIAIKQGNYFSIIDAADLDGDGRDEIIALGSPPGEDATYLYAYTVDGTLLWRRLVSDADQSWRTKHLTVVSSAGRSLIAVGTGEGSVMIFDRKGTPWPPQHLGHSIRSLCTARIGQGRQALVVCTDRGVMAYSVSGRPAGLGQTWRTEITSGRTGPTK